MNRKFKFYTLSTTTYFISSADEMLYKQGYKKVTNIKDADLLVYLGGADIDPALYNQPRHPATQTLSPYMLDERTKKEILAFMLSPDKVKLGICRGAQLLNVLNKGSLFQHVAGGYHVRKHSIGTIDGKKFDNCSSTHHQMMIPNIKRGGKVLAWAVSPDSKGDSTWYTPFFDKKTPLEVDKINLVQSKMSTSIKEIHKDCEVVWYEDSKSLCVQGHPESDVNSAPDYYDWVMEKVNTALKGKDVCAEL